MVWNICSIIDPGKFQLMELDWGGPQCEGQLKSLALKIRLYYHCRLSPVRPSTRHLTVQEMFRGSSSLVWPNGRFSSQAYLTIHDVVVNCTSSSFVTHQNHDSLYSWSSCWITSRHIVFNDHNKCVPKFNAQRCTGTKLGSYHIAWGELCSWSALSTQIPKDWSDNAFMNFLEVELTRLMAGWKWKWTPSYEGRSARGPREREREGYVTQLT